MPALLSMPKKALEEAIYFVVNYCIEYKKMTDKAVHNLAFFYHTEITELEG